jgi:hypothetical protein
MSHIIKVDTEAVVKAVPQKCKHCARYVVRAR